MTSGTPEARLKQRISTIEQLSQHTHDGYQATTKMVPYEYALQIANEFYQANQQLLNQNTKLSKEIDRLNVIVEKQNHA